MLTSTSLNRLFWGVSRLFRRPAALLLWFTLRGMHQKTPLPS